MTWIGIGQENIIGCPYCYQLLQLTYKQVVKINEILNRGKNCTVPCSKCSCTILITKEGTEQIPGEMEKHRTGSCCHKECIY